jgi:hypothetical protein
MKNALSILCLIAFAVNAAAAAVIQPYRFASGSSDPSWANVKLLAHMNGTDASTTFTDSSTSAHTITAFGDAQLDTATYPTLTVNTASGLFDGTGDYLTTDSSADYAFGTGDFTIEFWMKTTDGTANVVYLSSAGSTGHWAIIMQSGYIYFQSTYNSANVAYRSNTSLINGSWHHFAFTRSGTSNRMFFDGVQQGATETDSTNYDKTSVLKIGDGPTGGYNGSIDELRITKGTARYTADFTPTIAEFPNQ